MPWDRIPSKCPNYDYKLSNPFNSVMSRTQNLPKSRSSLTPLSISSPVQRSTSQASCTPPSPSRAPPSPSPVSSRIPSYGRQGLARQLPYRTGSIRSLWLYARLRGRVRLQAVWRLLWASCSAPIASNMSLSRPRACQIKAGLFGRKSYNLRNNPQL